MKTSKNLYVIEQFLLKCIQNIHYDVYRLSGIKTTFGFEKNVVPLKLVIFESIFLIVFIQFKCVKILTRLRFKRSGFVNASYIWIS